MAPELIVIAGAPGSGKTTICQLLRDALDCPTIELGRLREFHLDNEWSQASEPEEFMAFENALFIVRNYLRYGYGPVILTDLQDERVKQVPLHFYRTDFRIFSLIVHDDAELKRRVLLPERDSGFRNYTASLAWNRRLIAREAVRNELKIDNSAPDPADALDAILAAVSKST